MGTVIITNVLLLLLLQLLLIADASADASCIKSPEDCRNDTASMTTGLSLLAKRVHTERARLLPRNHCSPDGTERNDKQKVAEVGVITHDFPVDVVYTWVAQPTQEQFQNLRQECPHLTGGWQRVRNLGGLKFSLRMLEQNLPWVRKVFLVTDGIMPGWLDTTNTKLHLVQHKDIWPPDRVERELPVHNSQPIEAHLHRITGLSESFIYFNNDRFVGRPLNKSFFFAAEGTPIVHTKPGKKPWHRDSWCSLRAPLSYWGNHMPYVLSVSVIQEMQARWPATFAKISAARCRGDISLNDSPPFLYQWYGLNSNAAVTSHGGVGAWLNNVNLKDAPAWYVQNLAHPPDLVCINDDFDTKDKIKFGEQVAALTKFYQSFSRGKPSKFELQTPVEQLRVSELEIQGEHRLPVLMEATKFG